MTIFCFRYTHWTDKNISLIFTSFKYFFNAISRSTGSTIFSLQELLKYILFLLPATPLQQLQPKNAVIINILYVHLHHIPILLIFKVLLQLNFLRYSPMDRILAVYPFKFLFLLGKNTTRRIEGKQLHNTFAPIRYFCGVM